jgi:hypothetical protein
VIHLAGEGKADIALLATATCTHTEIIIFLGVMTMFLGSAFVLQ